jgi:hypothetical protein
MVTATQTKLNLSYRRVKELKGERARPHSENLSDDHYLVSGYNDADNGMDDNSGDEDEEQFLNDDFVESDDPDLYKEEDDTFLDDEDFPDENVNILDEEFLHDGNDRLLADPPAALPPQNTYAPQRQKSPSALARYGGLSSAPQSSNPSRTSQDMSHRSTTSSNLQYDRSRSTFEDQHKGLSLSPVSLQDADGSDTMAGGPSAKSSRVNHMSRTRSSGGDSYQSKQLDIDSIMFDADTIDEFIKLHRAEVREVTDYTKKETKLLANFSLGLSSRRNLQEGETSSIKDDIKTSSEFIDYLGNLDEVLDIKMAAIEALRDRIRMTLGEDAY